MEREFFYFPGPQDNTYESWLGHHPAKFRFSSAELRRRLLDGPARWPGSGCGPLRAGRLAGRRGQHDRPARHRRLQRRGGQGPCRRPWTRRGRTRCWWPALHDAPAPGHGGGDHELRRFTTRCGPGCAIPTPTCPSAGCPSRCPASGRGPVRDRAGVPGRRSLAVVSGVVVAARVALDPDPQRGPGPRRRRGRGRAAVPCPAPRWSSPATRSAWRASATPAPAGRSHGTGPMLGPDHLARYRELAALRRACHALRRGGLRWAHAEGDAIAFLRERAPAAAGPRRPGRARAAAPSHRRPRPGRRGTQPVRRRRSPATRSRRLRDPARRRTFQLWQLA